MSESSRPETGYSPGDLVQDWRGEAPDPELLGAFLDGELDAVDRGIVESWLEDDPDLAAELEHLREVRADLGLGAPPVVEDVPVADPEPLTPIRRRVRPARWKVVASLAAALATVVGLALVRGDRSDAGRIVDGGFEIRIVDGGVDVAGDLPAAFAGSIEAALRSGQFEIPESAAALRLDGGSLLSAEAQPQGPGPVSPIGTFVLDARPLFRWRSMPGATEYRVTVADEALHTVASSSALAGVGWRPDSALPAGRVLTWQVAATTATGTVLAPKPPAPEARFVVLTVAERTRLEARLELAGDSRLAAALAYLEVGLLDRAERELDLLAREQRDPEAVERLRASIRSAGGG